jgi:VanZ family protein
MLDKVYLISIGMFIGAFVERNDLFAPLRVAMGVE